MLMFTSIETISCHSKKFIETKLKFIFGFPYRNFVFYCQQITFLNINSNSMEEEKKKNNIEDVIIDEYNNQSHF